MEEHGPRRDQEARHAGPVAGQPTAGKRRRSDDYAVQADAQFVRSVRVATMVAFEETAWHPPAEVFVFLARELAARGIDPEPAAVFDAAVLISRGRRPAVLSPDLEHRHRGQVSS